MEYVNVDILRVWMDEIKEQMNNIGIEYGNVRFVGIAHNSHDCWGTCYMFEGFFANRFRIEVTTDLLLCSEKDIKETLAHELIHTCEGCQDHGTNFKRIANIMNQTYGYNIKQYNFRKKYKYVLVCKECGSKNYFTRKHKFVREYEKCRCTLCHGKLNLIKLSQM